MSTVSQGPHNEPSRGGSRQSSGSVVIKTLSSSLKQLRENIDSYHSGWSETVSKMCNEVGTTPSMPRTCGRQRHRASIPTSNPSEYFIRTITVPILELLLSEFDKRFSSHKNAFQGLLVPSVLVTEDLATVSSVVMKVGELYAEALPNVSSLSGQIHNWYTKWKSEEKDHS